MSFNNLTRRVGKTSYSANSAQSLDLPRKNLYRDLILWLKGSVVVTDVTTPPVVFTGGIGSGLKIIKRIEVIANGRDTLKSLSLSALAMKNQFLFGERPQITESLLTAATHPFGGVLHLPFTMPRAIREIDTFLNSGKLATLELRVTYGATSDMYSTQPTALTEGSTVADLEVHVNEAIRLDGKQEPYAAYKELYIEKDVVAAAAEFQILLPVGNRYRGFMLECESDGEMVDTILKKITIKSGTDVYKAVAAYEGTTYKPAGGAIRGDNVKCFGLSDEALTGYYYIDFCPEGRMVDALDATRLSSLEMILDVAHPGSVDKVRIYPCEIVPPMPV